MKKKILIIITITITVLITTGLITSYIDSARVRNSVEPKYTLKLISSDGKKITYIGLGYKVIRYVNVSPNEPYKNNKGVKYGNWFMHYELVDEKPKESKYITTNLKNISVSIKDISPTGATITIKDTNKQQCTYGEWYTIEKQINNKWYELTPLKENYGFNEIGYLKDNNNEVKFVIDWRYLYGELPLGSYRILKQVNNQYIEIEFSIATTSLPKIEVIKPVNYNSIKFNKYLEKNNRTIYLKGNIEEIYYSDSTTKVTLKDYFTKTYQTLDDALKNITDLIPNTNTLKDGGTTIYKSNKYDITLVKCNTINGNKDIFIGDYEMNFDNISMCK